MSDLTSLGAAVSGDLPVPSLADAFNVGWYPFTARPGTTGNSVIVGHVDTYLGAAAFYDLYLLKPGDQIYVEIGRHRDARYTVRWVEQVPKSHFPVSSIFGNTRSRHLWLITCGGSFNYITRHYVDNIVVSAS